MQFHDCRNFNIVAQALQVERPYFIYKEVNKENVLCVLCFKFFGPLICRCCLMPWCNMTIPHPQTWRRGQTERWRSTELLDWISRTTLSTRFLSSSPVTEEHCSQRWCLQTSCKGIPERDYSSLILHSVGQSLFFCIWTWLHLVIMYVVYSHRFLWFLNECPEITGGHWVCIVLWCAWLRAWMRNWQKRKTKISCQSAAVILELFWTIFL